MRNKNKRTRWMNEAHDGRRRKVSRVDAQGSVKLSFPFVHRSPSIQRRMLAIKHEREQEPRAPDNLDQNSHDGSMDMPYTTIRLLRTAMTNI